MPKVSALGLDVGKKRIGVAGCDGTGLIATGLTTIDRSSFAQDLKQLQEIIDRREARILVIGLPYSMNGTIGPQARQVQKWARRIEAALKLPIEFVDERLTSIEAIEQLKQNRKYIGRHNKGLIDATAAAIILQQWLDQQRSLH